MPNNRLEEGCAVFGASDFPVVESCPIRRLVSQAPGRNASLCAMAVSPRTSASRRYGSKCEELKVRKASLQYPNEQTRFDRCEKFRRRAKNGPMP